MYAFLEWYLIKHKNNVTLLWQQEVKCLEVNCVLKQKAWQLSHHSATGKSVEKTVAFVTNFSIT